MLNSAYSIGHLFLSLKADWQIQTLFVWLILVIIHAYTDRLKSSQLIILSFIFILFAASVDWSSTLEIDY